MPLLKYLLLTGNFPLDKSHFITVNKRSRLLTRNKKQKLGISKTSQTAAEITSKCSTPAFTKDICAIIAWNYRWSNFLGICIIDSLHHFGGFLLNAST